MVKKVRRPTDVTKTPVSHGRWCTSSGSKLVSKAGVKVISLKPGWRREKMG